MSYTRGVFYIWSDGERTWFNDLAIPDDLVDEFVAMRWAGMTAEEQETTCIRAIEKWSGNFGCDPLSEARGLPTTLDRVDQYLEQARQSEEGD